MIIKAKLDDNGYITDWCSIGELEGSKQFDIDIDEDSFREQFGAYKLVDGKLVYDEDYLSILHEKELSLAKIRELKEKLSKTDYLAIKHSEGFISEEEYESIKAERQNWRNEINALERTL